MTKSTTTLAFVFPGQGSQQVGMLKECAAHFPIIQKTFDESREALGKDLWEITQHSATELDNTINTQPILLTAGVALWRVWQARHGAIPHLLAGHSLGEYTALVCANALSFQDGVRLVAKRGEYMQAAVPVGVGAMAAVLGLDDKILQEVCQMAAQGEVVAPANYNTIGQTVIAGNKAAVERASVLAKEKGAKKVIPLAVSVPSHCDLMQQAASQFAIELNAVKIAPPTLPIIHNVNVQMATHPDDIRENLRQQLFCPVRWVEIIQRLASEGIQTVVECGPGKILTGLIKRIEPALTLYNIEIPADLEKALLAIR